MLNTGEQVHGKHYDILTPPPDYKPLVQDDLNRFYYVDLKEVDYWGYDKHDRRGYAFLQIDDYGNLVQADPFAYGLDRDVVSDFNPKTGKYELCPVCTHEAHLNTWH